MHMAEMNVWKWLGLHSSQNKMSRKGGLNGAESNLYIWVLPCSSCGPILFTYGRLELFKESDATGGLKKKVLKLLINDGFLTKFLSLSLSLFLGTMQPSFW